MKKDKTKQLILPVLAICFAIAAILSGCTPYRSQYMAGHYNGVKDVEDNLRKNKYCKGYEVGREWAIQMHNQKVHREQILDNLYRKINSGAFKIRLEKTDIGKEASKKTRREILRRKK